MKESRGYKIFKVCNVVILLFVVFITLFPFLNVVAKSFSSEAQIRAGTVSIIPRGFNVNTYRMVMKDKTFWTSYRNTIFYTVLGTSISLFVTTIMAYALSKEYLVGRKFFIGMAVFTMFFGGGIIPNYILVKNLKMTNTIWAIVIPNALNVYNMLIMKSFFEAMPEELEEAAAIDGLNTYGILRRIVLPLSKPVLATMTLFYAVGYWNGWFSAFLYLDDKNLFPVSIYLRNLIKGASTSTSITGAAGGDELTQVASNIKAVTMFLSVIPILMVYPFVQKYFVSGIMLGAVKQ